MGSAKDYEEDGIRFLQDACRRLDVEPERAFSSRRAGKSALNFRSGATTVQ